ncbi:MAG: SDR family NAD(P)-dependent oxidoreductase [Candidatus Ruminococcus intestinipullorum]|nr:SDR family NAD(P)-dependent oxidoreductase [Candidatus Ruminococcus intestinipullorum]
MNKKSVLITGASRGIGKACAITFAQAGFHVFLNCKNSVDDLKQVANHIQSHNGSCTITLGDVGNPDDVTTIFQTIAQSNLGLDVLINNAGVSHIGLLQDMTDSEWLHLMHTNLSSVFYCSRAAIPYMLSKKSGKIINISSMWGTVGASCEAAYSATKAGIHGLTKALAKELAPSNIQVNAIACGVIDTAMNSCFSDEEQKALMDEIPAGRFGTTNETAQFVLDLACNHPYLTGQIIGFDGGFI